MLCAAISLDAQVHTKRQLYKWGDDCLRKRNYECAENAFRKLLEKEQDPARLSQCYNNLGYACRETGRHAEAMEYYTAATEKDPGNWRAWSNIGNALLSDERYTEALENFTKAVENGADDNVRQNRAYTYQKLRMWDEAASDYEQLMERNPRDFRAVLNLASVLINRGDNEKAAEYADRAIALNEKSASAYVTKGIALLNLRDRAAARESFERAVALGSDNPPLAGFLEKCNEQPN